jgi:hypothetical protein
VYKDILEDSWVVQEERQEGKREGLYQAVIAVVQARFPEIVDLTKKQIDSVVDSNSLQDLLVKICLVQDVQEAVQALFALDKKDD